jgi:hypothetical protein
MSRRVRHRRVSPGSYLCRTAGALVYVGLPCDSGHVRTMWLSSAALSFTDTARILRVLVSISNVCFTPESGHVRCTSLCLLWAKSGHSRQVRPFIEKRYRRDVEHARARARALYRFRSGLLAGPVIQNNNPDHGCDYQRATESRCQCPVIYCGDLHVCRLGGAANAICEVGHKATGNFADPRRENPYFLVAFKSSSAAETPRIALRVKAVGCGFHSETSFSALSSSGLVRIPAISFTCFLGGTFESLKYAYAKAKSFGAPFP